tara:strand:- start:98 stop:487 length:390 start_codon:yes stop_codon:yes gene_type:complete
VLGEKWTGKKELLGEKERGESSLEGKINSVPFFVVAIFQIRLSCGGCSMDVHPSVRRKSPSSNITARNMTNGVANAVASSPNIRSRTASCPHTSKWRVDAAAPHQMSSDHWCRGGGERPGSLKLIRFNG